MINQYKRLSNTQAEELRQKRIFEPTAKNTTAPSQSGWNGKGIRPPTVPALMKK